MKMVKCLLLGTAAGLVAMTGAQAADLPVKAKPVQYVKICSLYGAGFYYIPGTDMCLKMGGWVRAEYAVGNNGSSTDTVGGYVNNRNSTNSWWRNRGYITADARNQTEYGTVRAYFAVGINSNSTGLDNAANQLDANRAFIQLAGFTFGRTQSFYDFYSSPAVAYNATFAYSDTGDPGWMVGSYTAQFGNGLSASLGIEQRRMTQIADVNAGGVTTGVISGGSFSTAGSTASSAGAYAGNNVPDIVANLRVDQAWGSAQVMGALHEVNAAYYGGAGLLENSGHPSDAWGFAVGAGLKLNAPMIGPGDYFQSQVNYTQGALRYIFFGPGVANEYVQRGQNAAYGVMSDSVYGGSIFTGTASSQQLTTAWNVNASYEHFWSTQWRTSLYTGYAAVSYNGSANAMLCSAEASGNGAGSGILAVATAGCNNNWSTYWLGSRTQWNVTADTYMGLDVLYINLQSAQTFNGVVAANTIPTSTATAGQAVSNMGVWMARFRVHKDFYP